MLLCVLRHSGHDVALVARQSADDVGLVRRNDRPSGAAVRDAVCRLSVTASIRLLGGDMLLLL